MFPWNRKKPIVADALNAAAGALAADYMRSPEAKAVITKAVKETVDRHIQESLRTYSAFGKQVEEAVGKALQLHGDIDLPSYNDAILKIVAAQVEHATKQSIEAQVAERMKDLLTPAPATIRLSELVKQYVEMLREKENSGCVCYGDRKEITFQVSEISYGMFREVILDPEHNTKRHEIGRAHV